MLKRVVTSAPRFTTGPTFSFRTAAVAAPSAASAASVSSRGLTGSILSEGLGNGKVIPLKFDYLRPAYIVPSYTKQFGINMVWTNINHGPNFILCLLVLFAAHGGFSGHLPPDPHELWH